MLIGANFLRSMKGGIRIEGDEITIYKKVTRIKTSNQTEIAEIAELEVSEEEFLEINESIYFNQEGSKAFLEQFKPVIYRLKHQGYIREEPLKHWKKNGVLCKLDIINPDITIEDKPLKHVTPAIEDSFKKHVDSLLKIGAIRPSKSRHRTMAMIINSGTTIDPVTGREMKRKERMTKKGLRSFLGILNYARNHIPKLGILLRPLYEKTNAHGDKRLKSSDYELVRKIKEQVQNLPDLEIPPENAYIILETDGCMEGWGGIVKWKKRKEDPREYEDHVRRSHKDFQPLPRIFTKTIFTQEEPGALYRRYHLKANQTPIRMDKSDAWRSVAQDLELSAAKETVKAMQNLQAIIQCKAQICFGKSTKDNHWSDQREDVRIQNKEARRILIELEALAQGLGCNNI
uniref:ORFIII-like polyprotein n=1 Tax=Tanacetum cinerariifolium TaxID=118510 RepID=A0A699GXK5_TANCI|nr:ORFIII-like polyprotein [Tanacetum cinerariifolium]